MENYQTICEEKGFDILKNFNPGLLDETQCRAWFLSWLYGRDVKCPRCGFPLQTNRRSRFFNENISFCSRCRKKYFPLKESSFHWTKLTYAELVVIMIFRELDVDIKVIAALVGRQPVAVKTAAVKIEKIKRKIGVER